MRGSALSEDWPYLTGFGLAAVGAVGSIFYMLAGGAEVLPAAAAGIGLVGLGQLAVLGLSYEHQKKHRARFRKTLRDVAELQGNTHNKLEFLTARLSRVEADARAQGEAVIGGISALKSSYSDLRQSLLAQAANPPPLRLNPYTDETDGVEIPESHVAVEGPVTQDDVFEALAFALEPIVDIQTKRTAHYRLHGRLNWSGTEISGDGLLQQVSANGLRARFDLLSMREALRLLAQLRQRDADLSILVGVGSDSLADAATVSNIIVAAAEHPSEAGGLVLELPHAVLAGLPERALEGLAGLARAGLGFAISEASVSGLDLAAMKTLNIRFVGLSAATLNPTLGPAPALIGFAQMARLAHISVFVSDVRYAATVPKLVSVSRLACGPCFAEPRKLRRTSADENDVRQQSLGLAA